MYIAITKTGYHQVENASDYADIRTENDIPLIVPDEAQILASLQLIRAKHSNNEEAIATAKAKLSAAYEPLRQFIADGEDFYNVLKADADDVLLMASLADEPTIAEWSAEIPF